MKKILFLSALLFSFFAVRAQIPAGYYDSAQGLAGSALKTALHKIIRNHTVRSYSQLWTDFQTTDKDSTGNVWDMYSNCIFVFGTNQDNGTGGTSECQFYNREHSMPNSWWGGTQDTMYTDLFHLIPADKYVNNTRGNNCFGEVSSPTHTFGNGGKMGPCSFAGYSGTVFEPVDEYKGDFARNYFYLATRYENKISTWTSDMLAGNSYPVFTTWAVNLLLKWSHQDPVSQKEIDRNNAVYGIQHNRNPFIDNPQWADSIWAVVASVYENKLNSIAPNIYPNPAADEVTYDYYSSTAESVEITLLAVDGRKVVENNFNKSQGSYSNSLDLKGIVKGMYFLRFKTKNNNYVSKLIVQ